MKRRSFYGVIRLDDIDPSAITITSKGNRVVNILAVEKQYPDKFGNTFAISTFKPFNEKKDKNSKLNYIGSLRVPKREQRWAEQKKKENEQKYYYNSNTHKYEKGLEF